MFTKVLVAEDIDSINIGVASALKMLKIQTVVHAVYCDEAYLKFKKAAREGEPFDLLISDLSFKKSHRNENLTSGEQLITTLKSEDPELKVIAFTIEDHPQKFLSLWETNNLDAYVCKDRNSLKDLRIAIESVFEGEHYVSDPLSSVLQKRNVLQLKEYEVELLTRLASGYSQDEIEKHFKENGIKPNSRSSIEKRLKELRDDFEAKTTIHLITIIKELRLI